MISPSLFRDGIFFMPAKVGTLGTPNGAMIGDGRADGRFSRGQQSLKGQFPFRERPETSRNARKPPFWDFETVQSGAIRNGLERERRAYAA